MIGRVHLQPMTVAAFHSKSDVGLHVTLESTRWQPGAPPCFRDEIIVNLQEPLILRVLQ
jgi:hypothetical protein